MSSLTKAGLVIIGGFILFIVVAVARDTEPLATPAQVNQALLEDCLRADRARIALYGEAKPTEDCTVRELAYARVTR